MNPVNESFSILVPQGRQEKLWKRAAQVLNHFDVEKLGEDLALKCLCHIVNHIEFPTDLKMSIILKAEGFFPELLGVNPRHEFHMAEIEAIEYCLNNGETFEEVCNLYKN